MAKRIGKKLISATSTQKIDGKLQPQALELEEAVLGALMIDNESLSDTIDSLQPEYFYKPGKANETSSSRRDWRAPWLLLIRPCALSLALRVSVSWGSEKSAVGLVVWVRLSETSVVILTPTEAGPGVRLLFLPPSGH
jgi:hypothetical protein